MLVRALEVPHEDLLQIHPTLDSVGQKVLQPCPCRISQEQWKVADNEIIIIRSTGLTSKPIILEPQSKVHFLEYSECWSTVDTAVGRRR